MEQIRTIGQQDDAWLGRKGDRLGIVRTLNFDHTTKYHMHKSESVLENEMDEILRDFEIPKNCLILTIKPELIN